MLHRRLQRALLGFNAAMAAAVDDPAGYEITYNYYIDTSTFTGSELTSSLARFVITGSGYLCAGLLAAPI